MLLKNHKKNHMYSFHINKCSEKRIQILVHLSAESQRDESWS